MDSLFVQYLNLGRVETLYRATLLARKDDLDDRSKDILLGAELAMMAVLGVNNKLTKMVGVDTSVLDREEMIEAAKAALIESSPDCEIVFGDPFEMIEDDCTLIEEPQE